MRLRASNPFFLRSAGLLLAAATAVSCWAQTEPALAAAEAHGQLNQDFQKAQIHVLPVQGNIYMLVGDGANITLSVGKQGALLVNTGFAQLSDKLLAEVRKLSPDKPLRYIINTSPFVDSVGGNESVRSGGTTITGANVTADITDARQGAAVLAHENVLLRMSAPSGKVSPYPSNSWPTDTFLSDEKDLYFNDESIQILQQPNATTDGDTFVYFRKSDVISAGNTFMTDSYPVIDIDKGGSIDGVIAGLNHMVRMSIVAHEEEGGTLIIPGHGHLCDQAELVEYRDLVTIIRDRIASMIKKGMTLQQVLEAHPSRDYDPLYGHNPWWTPEMFVTTAYKSMTQKPADKR
jgi:glyoxylase-like metal-dependent hydrolase (beta-lactamase superfamily II)